MKNLIKGSNQGNGTKRDCTALINSLMKEVISGGIRAKKSGKTRSKNHGKVIGAVKAIDKLTVWIKVLDKKKTSLFEKCFSFTRSLLLPSSLLIS
ncbi:MAG: hypothetical protein ACFFD4_33945, partial [Candidatus Odinarchaeota archaeon]